MSLVCIRRGGFKLTKFISNSREVLTTIPQERHHQKIKDQDLSIGDLPVERALGVHWNIENDHLGFKVNLKDKPLTRRGLLSNQLSIRSAWDSSIICFGRLEKFVETLLT